MDDIKAARKKQEEKEEKKVKSPYTKVYKEKFNFFPLIVAFIVVLFVSLIVYVVIKNIDKEPIRNSELMSSGIIKEDVL